MEPRPLSDHERTTLLLLLPEGAFPDVGTYREQVTAAEVVGKCPCGCATIRLRVDPSKARQASYVGSPLLPVEGRSRAGFPPRELILFAGDGWLDSLEIVYYDEPPPSSLPPEDYWEVWNKRDAPE